MFQQFRTPDVTPYTRREGDKSKDFVTPMFQGASNFLQLYKSYSEVQKQAVQNEYLKNWGMVDALQMMRKDAYAQHGIDPYASSGGATNPYSAGAGGESVYTQPDTGIQYDVTPTYSYEPAITGV